MKRTPLKRKSKNKRKKLIAECDRLVSLIVRARDKGCVICIDNNEKKSPFLQCGHLFKRELMAIRFDFRNCNCQCQYHNSLHRFDTHPYNYWFVKKFGKEAWNELYKKKSETRHWKVWELEELIVELRSKLAS